MEQYHPFISEVERFCADRGITPESLCRRATGNPRKWQRIIGKLDALDSDVERIRDTMNELAAGGAA